MSKSTERYEDGYIIRTTKEPCSGKAFHGRRDELGVKQRDLARTAGVSPSLISQYEGGRDTLKPDTLRRIWNVLLGR